ncbi:hypothetical protein QUF63_15555 [Anaerolineales bacterium HSG25]|nr:hypothetical protein [Anaerolineales bacterium HSG25]
MNNHRNNEYGQELFGKLEQLCDHPTKQHSSFNPHDTRVKELRKMKKFRFQLLHRWLVERFEPCRVADIAGGKGLLAYLLQRSGWHSAVIDPVNQALPHKYKDISTGKRVKLSPTDRVHRIDREFATSMAYRFDLLIGMHAHACNAMIIDIASELECGFVLFPCCVIDEPFYPPLGVQWLESVASYAIYKGHVVYPFRLNFKGQNIGLCSIGKRCHLLEE